MLLDKARRVVIEKLADALELTERAQASIARSIIQVAVGEIEDAKKVLAETEKLLEEARTLIRTSLYEGSNPDKAKRW